MGSPKSFVFFRNIRWCGQELGRRLLSSYRIRGRDMTGTLLFWLMVCVIALLAARLLVFQAACALVDVQPNVAKSFILPGLFWLGMVVIAYVLLFLPLLSPENRAYLFSSAETRPGSPPSLVSLFLVLGITALAILVVSWPIYLLTLPTSLRKSFIIATLEQLLLALLASLITAIVMIILAIVQVATTRAG
jgi:hypothetical protein